MDCNPPVSSVHGIFQARILEWVATSFSIHICKIKSSSCTYKINKTMEINSTPIEIKSQIKLPELGGEKTRERYLYELDKGYAMILIWHLQRFSLRTKGSNPLKGAWAHVRATRWKKKKDHRIIRATPSIQTLGIPEGHTPGKEQICNPCGWSETHTIPGPCTWVHFHTLQGDTSSPDPGPGVAWPLVRTAGLC